mmetsp:Transcript_21027/g.70617  ORF Transcript_21027/g.70617 Transcript_21027/m.70617 type:complete len:237 (+) Transcript_21027:1155-1865(+)
MVPARRGHLPPGTLAGSALHRHGIALLQELRLRGLPERGAARAARVAARLGRDRDGAVREVGAAVVLPAAFGGQAGVHRGGRPLGHVLVRHESGQEPPAHGARGWGVAPEGRADHPGVHAEGRHLRAPGAVRDGLCKEEVGELALPVGAPRGVGAPLEVEVLGLQGAEGVRGARERDHARALLLRAHLALEEAPEEVVAKVVGGQLLLKAVLRALQGGHGHDARVEDEEVEAVLLY